MKLALILATRDLPGYNYFKPLGLGYLKSYINMVFPYVDIKIYENINSLIQDRPDFIGISSATEDFSVAKEYIGRIKEELGVPVLLGGIHISMLPETLPLGIIGCIGEGEETIVELIKTLLSPGRFNLKELSKINGIVYYDNDGHLIQTQPRTLITPLDNIPFPDRDALGIKPGKEDTLYMFTSRGCPYTCKFCVSRKHWTKYREFSSKYVIHEMELLIKKYKVKHIHFFDDLFIVNRKRLEKIVNSFKEKGFDITTSCAVRANLVDSELCKLLKRLNITEVMFGAESFSEHVLKELKTGNVTVAQNQQAIDILHKYEIKTNVTMIFDAPEEKKGDLITSWKTIFNNIYLGKINKVGWGFLRPYPGSEYWNLALKKGNVSIDMNWELFKDWSNNIFHMNGNMTREEANKIIDEWETKCYLVNLNFRDTSIPVYYNKNEIFIKKENVIKNICEKEFKDDTDIFIVREYDRFLYRIKDNTMILCEGWEPEHSDNSHWIKKCATFRLKLPTKNSANILNLIFYVPNINYYQNNKLTITIEIDNTKKSMTILSEGLHTLSIPIPFFSIGNLFSGKGNITGKIICSHDFCPADVSESEDTRRLSIVITRFELAKDYPFNVISLIKTLNN